MLVWFNEKRTSLINSTKKPIELTSLHDNHATKRKEQRNTNKTNKQTNTNKATTKIYTHNVPHIYARQTKQTKQKTEPSQPKKQNNKQTFQPQNIRQDCTQTKQTDHAYTNRLLMHQTNKTNNATTKYIHTTQQKTTEQANTPTTKHIRHMHYSRQPKLTQNIFRKNKKQKQQNNNKTNIDIYI